METQKKSPGLDHAGKEGAAAGASDYTEAMNVVVLPGSPAEEICLRYTRGDTVGRETRVSTAEAETTSKNATLSDATPGEAAAAANVGSLPPGIPATPAEDLLFRGGKTIADLVYTNFFVGGQNVWADSDRRNIDEALAAAMSDGPLNDIMAQYFSGPISSTIQDSSFLGQGWPAVVSRGDIERVVRRLHDKGRLVAFPLASTVFNFMLPRGTILTTDDAPVNAELLPEDDNAKDDVRHEDNTKAGRGAVGAVAMNAVAMNAVGNNATGAEVDDDSDPITDGDEEDKASSVKGLGGYHGSVIIGADKVYYAVGVFSDVLDDGTPNGIIAFDQPWKNVVGTFYHELCEARTDPDVEEANNTGNRNLIGWTSHRGQECGDFPISEAPSLQSVFAEIPLANGQGTVPVQFQYSNRIHGPERPN